MRHALMASVALTLLVGVSGGADLPLASASPPSADTAVTSASVDRATFAAWCTSMAGTWLGNVDGSPVEEIWSQPRGNTMMGLFRWCQPSGDPVMMEMLSVTHEKDAVRLRIRHYTPALAAKEDADKPITLVLTSRSETKAIFTAERDARDLASVSYEIDGATLTIEVAFAAQRAQDGSPPKAREPLRFRLTRQ